MHGANHFRYDWTPDIWAWQPDVTRWTPSHGRAPVTSFVEFSTARLAPKDAYDFWRETVYYNFDADKRDPEDPTDFQGLGRALFGEEANFFSYRSGAVSGQCLKKHLKADDRDSIDIGLVFSGHRHYRGSDDSIHLCEPGQFFFFDETRPCRIARDAHEGMHLTLQRSTVEAALGCQIPNDGNTIAQALDKSSFAPAFKDQMRLLACHMEGLAQAQRSFLFEQTVQLAHFALQQLAFTQKSRLPEPARAALLTAAQRTIERHFTDPNLDTDRIAHRLGASRATLYRAFADQGLAVADTIREHRLNHVRHLLENAPTPISVIEIAAQSGFADIRTFYRAFQARFGMRPSDARAGSCAKR